MVSDPGSKLDFGTFIAYLMPGYILAFLLFCIGDSITILTSNHSLIYRIGTWGIAEITLVTIISVPISYFLGLILDNIAHPISLQSELSAKESAYKEALDLFQGLLNEHFTAILSDPEIKSFLMTFNTSSNNLASCTFFIDMMFYRLASPEVWGRQNWMWSFYELSRQLTLLLIPVTVVIGFYATLLIMTSISTNIILILIVPTVMAALLTGIVWISPVRRLFDENRSAGCRVYHRHRAWIVFAYLIETCLLAHPHEHSDENKSKGLVRIGDLIKGVVS